VTRCIFWLENALKCVSGRGSGVLPRTPLGELTAPPALPTCLLLTHVALCQRVRGVIARMRYIYMYWLTYLLTSVVLQVVQILVLIGLYFLKCTKFDQLILRKIIKIVATRCQILRLKCTIFDFILSPAFKQLQLKENVCGKQVMNKIGTIPTARTTPQSINQFTNDSIKCSNIEH